jgi:hypothetical protein
MRSAPVILLAVCVATATAIGCGAPDVEVPEGNDQITSDKPAGALAAPSVSNVPPRTPFGTVAIHGKAQNGVRVFVEGAGNPFTGSVQPIDGSFCVDVDLTTWLNLLCGDVQPLSGIWLCHVNFEKVEIKETIAGLLQHKPDDNITLGVGIIIAHRRARKRGHDA